MHGPMNVKFEYCLLLVKLHSYENASCHVVLQQNSSPMIIVVVVVVV